MAKRHQSRGAHGIRCRRDAFAADHAARVGLTFARDGRRVPGFAPAMKVLLMLQPWSMIEVGMLGILVAVIKLSSLVRVAPGAGIWATATLMVLITLIASRDLHQLWDWTEPARPDGHPGSDRA